ncbi:MAG: transglutaminase-like domain-containing protein [Planctomycetota bacterium]
MTVRSDDDAGESRRSSSQRDRRVRRWFALLMLGSIGAATGCYIDYRRDCARLKATAQLVVAGAESPADRVIALLHWVFANQSTKENPRYFLFPRLRATPCQVLETGGDCADKSRLLSALLREVGVPASMAMCFDPRTGHSTHTIVVAVIAPGTDMVVDPVYDLFFPRPEQRGYYGLLDLRRDATILPHRLDTLCAERPRSHPIHYYNRVSAVYSHASCMNWEKNGLTRILGDFLVRNDDDALYTIARPLVLEEPKLLVSLAAALLGIGAGFIYAVMARGALSHQGDVGKSRVPVRGSADAYDSANTRLGGGMSVCGR